MTFKLSEAIQILSKTPTVLNSLLSELPDPWIINNEGIDTWSPFDVIGHLIHGEKTDWIPRARIILSDLSDKRFIPFDRFAQFEKSKGKNIKQLLSEFESLRLENIKFLKNQISEKDFALKGIHPDFGEVTLVQLLATWVVHDLGHINQICRVMANNYREDIGPWNNYITIIQGENSN